MAKRPHHEKSSRRGPTARRSAPARRAPAASGASGEGGLGALALGFVAVAATAGAAFGWSAGCKHEPPPGATPTPPAASVVLRLPSAVDGGIAATDASAVGAIDPSKPYDGPLVGSIVAQAPVYITMEPLREKRVGYIRHGSKAPV